MHHRIALRARPHQLIAYSGYTQLVTNGNGVITGAGVEGLYVENTRLLSCAEPTADSAPLAAISASPVGGNALLTYAAVPGGTHVPSKAVYVERLDVLDVGLRSTFDIHNYDVQATARFEFALRLEADFADMTEQEQGQREQTADVETIWDAARQELLLRYCHPQLDRAVAIRVEQSPDGVRWSDGALRFALVLPPRAHRTIRIVAEPIFDGQRRTMPLQVLPGVATTPLERTRQQLLHDAPTLTSTNATVSRAWQTAVADLASLPLGLAEGAAAPSAGMPIYQQFFGRDTLTVGLQSASVMPEMLRDALRINAAHQGTTVDDWRDEQLGKMIHQARRGPLADLKLNPLGRYYGDWSTPQDFLLGLGQYLAWTGDKATVRALLPNARRVLDWLERDGDFDNDGFLEYITHSSQGVKHQGWKDAPDSIVDEHGAPVEPPIASSELQAYWYAGLLQMAWVYAFLGEWREAWGCTRKAHVIQRRFDAAFWMEKQGFYALGLGPDKRLIRSLGSNDGHLLAMGIVPREKAVRVVQRLMSPEMFSGWGIRTLSSDNPAYNPFSYHRGSVWPIENATFAFGFARYGCWDACHRLSKAIFDSSDLFVANRLPETMSGIARDPLHPHPGIYPQSNEPQAWSASAIMLTVATLLGLRPFAPWNLLVVNPHLPAWLPDLRLNGLRVGDARVDLQFWRTRRGTTRWRVAGRTGRLRVVAQPWA